MHRSTTELVLLVAGIVVTLAPLLGAVVYVFLVVTVLR